MLTVDGSAFDETANEHRFVVVGLAAASGYGGIGDSVAAGASIGMHLALANQPAIVAGRVAFEKAAWPSAVPHTSWGDAVPQTAYGMSSQLLTTNY